MAGSAQALDGGSRSNGGTDDARGATVRALEAALFARDPAERGHIERASRYATVLARAIDPAFVDDPGWIAGFRLHDVGKLALPDATLHRRGPLNARDWRLLHRHPEMGAEMVRATGVLEGAEAVVRCHHERWDGHGYPDGLAEERIPLGARIIFVADAFDAMTSDRLYRAALSYEEAVAEVERCAGTQFDPEVVRAFLSLIGAQIPVAV
jgi:ribonuclease P protein subunit RPR2